MKIFCALILLLFCLTAKAGWTWTNGATSAWIEIQANGNAGPNLLTSNAFTMSAWIMRMVDRGATRAVIIAKGITQPIIQDALCYEFSIVTNHLRFRYSPPGGGVIHTWEASTTAPNTNELAHVALKYTYGVSTSIVLFVNGTNYTGSWIVGDGTVPGTNNNPSMQFGCDGFATPFTGLFNEIAIWSSMLSNQDILSLYNSKLKRYPLMVSPDSLIGYWPLDGWFEYRDQTTDTVPFALNMKVYPDHYGKWYGSFEGFGGMCNMNERTFSYPPNE